MLTIDRMSLQLPAGFEHRAAGLVDLIGARLAAMRWPLGASIEHMRVEYVSGPAGAGTENAIADEIAASVGRRVLARP